MKEQKANSYARTAFGGVNIENGVYVVYKDGQHAKFKKGVSGDNVAFIGLAYDGHTFGVHLCGSKGRYPLINTRYKEAPKDELCLENEWEALMEWDFVKHTRHIQEIGTDIPLSEGEYLPTPANLMVMFRYQKEINEALRYVGGTPLDFNKTYWSCLRDSASNAWSANGNYGIFGGNSMYYSYVSVPLSLWEP